MNYRILAVVEETAHDTGVQQVSEPVADEHATTVTESGDTHATDTQAESSHAITSTEEHGGESQGIAALGLDPIAIGAQLLTFLVLFVVVKKYALEGIVKNSAKRNEDINRGLHLTAVLDKEKADLDLKVEEALKAARKDADKIIAEAHSESNKIIQAAEIAAGRKAEDVMKAAEGKIERDIAEARKGLKSEMAELITEATEAVLNQKLDSNSDRKLVEDYLKGAMK